MMGSGNDSCVFGPFGQGDIGGRRQHLSFAREIRDGTLRQGAGPRMRHGDQCVRLPENARSLANSIWLEV